MLVPQTSDITTFYTPQSHIKLHKAHSFKYFISKLNVQNPWFHLHSCDQFNLWSLLLFLSFHKLNRLASADVLKWWGSRTLLFQRLFLAKQGVLGQCTGLDLLMVNNLSSDQTISFKDDLETPLPKIQAEIVLSLCGLWRLCIFVRSIYSVFAQRIHHPLLHFPLDIVLKW